MKKSLVLTILGVVAVAHSSHATGTIYFQNYFGSTSPKVTYDPNPALAPAGKAGLALGGSFAAELFWFNGITSDPTQLTGVAGSITGFGLVTPAFPNSVADGDLSSGAGWFIGASTLSLPGAPVGTTVTLEVVAFNGSSGYHGVDTTVEGASALFQRTLGGGVIPPASLQGFPNFTVSIPEPSTFALSGLGAASLIAFRRKRVS